MIPEDILRCAGNLKHSHLDYGRTLYDFITLNRLSVGLELCSAPSIITAYLAGAIHGLKAGHLTTIGVSRCQLNAVDLPGLLADADLSYLVSIQFEPKSFNWGLMKLLRLNLYESFDFCCIHGRKTWYEVGLAFCLVERLIKAGGWVVFDDLQFSFRRSAVRDEQWVRNKPEEEQITEQVMCVFELLAQANPNFGAFRKQGTLGFAQKRESIWSGQRRAHLDEEILICKAAEKARSDPEYRVQLCQSPSQALAVLDAEVSARLKHIRFVDTDHAAPVSPVVNGEEPNTVYLERPRWRHPVSEDALRKLLEN